MFADKNKIVVCCPDEFLRKGNVEFICEKFDIKMIDSSSDFINYLKEKTNSKNIIEKEKIYSLLNQYLSMRDIPDIGNQRKMKLKKHSTRRVFFLLVCYNKKKKKGN